MSSPAGKFQQMRIACERKDHGTRARYASGCRCVPCRAANSRYESERLRRRADGDWNGIVDASRAREHLVKLSRQGVGRRAVSEACDVCETVLSWIRSGRRGRIRARTERAILAVDAGAAAAGTRVSARHTWERLNELLRRGYSKAQLARWLGYRSPAIQIRHTTVLASTAVAVERMYALVNAGKLSR